MNILDEIKNYLYKLKNLELLTWKIYEKKMFCDVKLSKNGIVYVFMKFVVSLVCLVQSNKCQNSVALAQFTLRNRK